MKKQLLIGAALVAFSTSVFAANAENAMSKVITAANVESCTPSVSWRFDGKGTAPTMITNDRSWPLTLFITVNANLPSKVDSTWPTGDSVTVTCGKKTAVIKAGSGYSCTLESGEVANIQVKDSDYKNGAEGQYNVFF